MSYQTVLFCAACHSLFVQLEGTGTTKYVGVLQMTYPVATVTTFSHLKFFLISYSEFAIVQQEILADMVFKGF